MDIEGVLAISLLFLGLPWLLLHYITQWKRAGGLSVEDEQLLDEMHETARRLEERLVTVERIVADDHPHAGVMPARPAAARPAEG